MKEVYTKIPVIILCLIVLFVNFATCGRACGGNYNECDLGHWQSWSRCNASCGGGYRTRQMSICCNVNEVKTLDQCLARCNITKDEFVSAATKQEECGTRCYNKGKFNKTSFSCECINGTWDTCCQGQENDCKSNPCSKHGRCYDRLFDYQCYCNSRQYHGKQCELNYCANKVCHNRAHCVVERFYVNRRYVYKPICQCKDLKYYGPACDKNHCDKLACDNNSTCYARRVYNSKTRSYEYQPACRCLRGYYGRLCEYVDGCASIPCLNRARCNRHADNFTCQCRTCYSGHFCENYIHVNSTYCPTTTTSTTTMTTTTAILSTTFDPTFPSTATALSATTTSLTGHNMVWLSTTDAGHSLYIPTKTVSKRQTTGHPYQVLTNCLGVPCVHGSCIKTAKGPFCYCSPGFQGNKCDIETNECDALPCMYGECIDQVNGYKCDCNPLFKGVHCSKMEKWAIAFLSVASVLALLSVCCCIWFLPPLCRKKDDDEDDDKSKVKPLPPSLMARKKAWLD